MAAASACSYSGSSMCSEVGSCWYWSLDGICVTVRLIMRKRVEVVEVDGGWGENENNYGILRNFRILDFLGSGAGTHPRMKCIKLWISHRIVNHSNTIKASRIYQIFLSV